VCPQV